MKTIIAIILYVASYKEKCKIKKKIYLVKRHEFPTLSIFNTKDPLDKYITLLY